MAASKYESSGVASTIICRLVASGVYSNVVFFDAILVKDSSNQLLLKQCLQGSYEILNLHDHDYSYSTVYINYNWLK